MGIIFVVTDIILNKFEICACTRVYNDCRLLSSNQWHERKEGLMSLQYYVHNIKSLTPTELRRATEVFTRMFHDPHAKVCLSVQPLVFSGCS